MAEGKPSQPSVDPAGFRRSALHPAEMIGEDCYLHGDWGIDPQLIAAITLGEK